MPKVPRASKPAAGGDSGMLWASITADTPDAAHSLRDRPRVRRTHPSPHGHDREPQRQRVARLRHAVAADQHRPAAASSASPIAAGPPLRMSRPSAASPTVPDTTTRSPGLAPPRWTISRRNPAERRDRDHRRARRRNSVAAEQRTIEQGGVLAKPARERRQPGIVGGPQRQRQHEAGRRGALGGEIGQVHPQRLARDGVGGSSGRKCTPSTMASVVTTISSPTRAAGSRVIVETERAGIGRERLEIARDQGVFAGCGSATPAKTRRRGTGGRSGRAPR